MNLRRVGIMQRFWFRIYWRYYHRHSAYRRYQVLSPSWPVNVRKAFLPHYLRQVRNDVNLIHNAK